MTTSDFFKEDEENEQNAKKNSEKELVELFEKLTEQEKNIILVLLRAIVKK